MALLKIKVWCAFTQKYTPSNYYKLLWNGTIYYDNAEVTIPQTNSGHTEEFSHYHTTFGGGSRAGQVTLYTTDCTGLFTALVSYIKLT